MYVRQGSPAAKSTDSHDSHGQSQNRRQKHSGHRNQGTGNDDPKK
jgi:hypothetical protein